MLLEIHVAICYRRHESNRDRLLDMYTISLLPTAPSPQQPDLESYPEFLADLLPIPKENHGCWSDCHCKEAEETNTPSIPQLFEKRGREEWYHSSNQASEDCTCRNS